MTAIRQSDWVTLPTATLSCLHRVSRQISYELVLHVNKENNFLKISHSSDCRNCIRISELRQVGRVLVHE